MHDRLRLGRRFVSGRNFPAAMCIIQSCWAIASIGVQSRLMNVAKLKRKRRIACVTAFTRLPNLPDVSKFLIGIFMDISRP